MANQLTGEIEARIQTFVAELNVLVRKAAIESVSIALGADGAAPRRGPGRPPRAQSASSVAASAGAARPRRRRKGAKRDPNEIVKLTEAVKAHVKAHRGEGVETIAKHLKVRTDAIKLPIAKLLAVKAITKKGVKRATRYFPA